METIEMNLIRELKSIGHRYKGIEDIFKHELPPDVVKIILKWLPEVYEEHLGSGEVLVRSLISAIEPFDPRTLIDLFENASYNKTIKNTIAYVLAISKTYDISNWIRNQLLNKEPSFERAGLLYGLVKKTAINDTLELMHVLKSLFDKYFYFETFQKLYKKYANTNEDITFLKEKVANPELAYYFDFIKESDKYFGDKKAKTANKRYEKELMKLIEAISKRKITYKFPASMMLSNE